MLTQPNVHQIAPHATTTATTYVAEAVLFGFCLMSLGVLEPKFDTVSINDMTLQQAVDLGSPDFANQLKWFTLAGVATLAVYHHVSRFITLMSATWPLLLIIAYCLMSAIWSDYPDTTIRRSFGLFIPFYCLIASLAVISRPERIARIIYVSFYAALVCNILSLPLPSAFDEFGFFRGITTNKNVLGGIGGLAVLCGVALFPLFKGTRDRTLRLLYMIGWSCLLILSVSKTSITLALCVPLIFYALLFLSICLGVGVGTAGFLLVCLLGLSAIASYAAFDTTPSDFVHLVWPDATFTGRTLLWSFMVDAFSKNWIAGIGFGSFWGVGNKSPNLYAPMDYIRLTNQAHNGYLDLLVTLGVIGLVLLTALLLKTMARAETFRYRRPWLFRFVWFNVIFCVIHNTMESSLLVPFSTVWHVTLLTYVLTLQCSNEDTL